MNAGNFYYLFQLVLTLLFCVVSESTIVHAQPLDTPDEGKTGNGNTGDNLINNATVIAAILAAIASIFAAVLSGIFGSINQNKLKRLEAVRAHEDAELDYKYEARKRLYSEFEPLLFQLYELSARASKRIMHLARDSKEGNLEPSKGSLSHHNFVYSVDTIGHF